MYTCKSYYPENRLKMGLKWKHCVLHGIMKFKKLDGNQKLILWFGYKICLLLGTNSDDGFVYHESSKVNLQRNFQSIIVCTISIIISVSTSIAM